MAEEKRIIECPQCSGKLRVPLMEQSLKVKCPHCGHAFEHGVSVATQTEKSSPDTNGSREMADAPATERPKPGRPDITRLENFFRDYGVSMYLSAVLLGIWLGGTPGEMSRIGSIGTWLGSVALVTILVGIASGICAVVLAFMGAILLWFLPKKIISEETATDIALVTGFFLWGAVTLAVPVAYTWAWVGHSSSWRVAPYEWSVSSFPSVRDSIREFLVGKDKQGAASTGRMWADRAMPISDAPRAQWDQPQT